MPCLIHRYIESMTHRAETDSLIIRSGTQLYAALEAMDKNAQGIVFVVDGEKKLLGVLTDGDVRRHLLEKASFDIAVDGIMTSNCTSLPADSSIETIQKTLSDKIRHIPLLDEKGCIVDHASANRLRRIPVMEPSLAGNELNYVTQCVQTSWISSQGKFVSQLEDMLAEYCGAPHALAVSNGTVALHLAMVALGIGKGDEVIVPDLTFAASINAIIYCGATPVIVDCADDSWNVSAEKIKPAITNRTKAIMPVHLYGHPCAMDDIMALAKEHGLLVVEDAAEALGSEWKGKRVGSFGHVATFSFFGNKTITTGEGGMILFQDKEVYEHAKVLRDHGMNKQKRYWHDHVGFNYRMTNMQAAIGVAQMERVNEIISSKCALGHAYSELFASEDVLLPPVHEHAKDTFWLYTIRLKNTELRDELIAKLMANGIETRPVFYPLSQMPPYLDYAKNPCPNAASISASGISLPSSVGLAAEQQQSVAKTIHSLLETKALLGSTE